MYNESGLTIKKNVIKYNKNKIISEIIKKRSNHESIYLWMIGFRKRSQFNLLLEWYNRFWNDKLFINKISFKEEDFFKRIQIIKPNNTSNKAIKFLNLDNNFVEKNPNLKALLLYIKKSNEHRKKINQWITGSAYSNATLKIFVKNVSNSSFSVDPYHVATCFNYVDVYNTEANSKENYKINKRIQALDVQINYDIKNPVINH